ncbi:MAG: AAA family ATPase [Xanthomonadales bacterium]|nr:AAA family ATPase [Xanthomonadales bacterium]
MSFVLRRLRVEAFRRFATAVDIVGLGSGLNLIHGPNEAGKSTLAQALRTLFFERHSSKGAAFVAAIAPQGVHGAAPRIDAEFELGGQDGAAAKVFFHKPRAELRIGSERWDADGADEELARRFGFALALRGQSRAETQGIPGLLWIEQGTGAELASAVEHATAPLEERLRSILGDLSGSAGGGVAAFLQAELGRLRTGTGKSTGVLAAAERAFAEAEAERSRCAAAADEHRELSDRLVRSLAERDRLELEKPWLTIEADRRRAEEARSALEPQRQKLAAERRHLLELEAKIAGLRRQIAQRERELAELAGQREAAAGIAQRHRTATAALTAADARASAARAARDAARTTCSEAELREQHARASRELARLDADLAREQALLDKAAAHGEAMASLGASLGQVRIAPARVAKLAELVQARQANRVQREATATRIQYRLAAGRHIEAAGLGVLEGEGNHLLTAPLTLCIEGVGEIEITPGGGDTARLADEARRLDAAIAALCSELGIADPAAAEARQVRQRELEQQLALHEAQREALLGGADEDSLRLRLAGMQGQRRELAGRVETQPTAPDGPELPAARRLLADAELEATTAAEALETQRSAASAAELERERLAAAIAASGARLEGEEAGATALAASEALADALARRDVLAADVATAEARMEAQQPALIDADIERYGRALDVLERERQQLREAISALRARLETLGADGIDEKHAAAVVGVDQAERRLAECRLRADALALLTSRLEARREAFTQRLYAPLRERLAHYLAILFPGPALAVGIDALRPTALARDGCELALEALSHGTREQLGVVARFAYADLLAMAGQPTLLVLDDALVHSDGERRQQMKRILHDAATRHQVLLFTCHPEHWRDAGARVMIDLARLA